MEDKTAPIVLVNGTRDNDGEAWIGDFTHSEPFWAALRIAENKIDDFHEAYERFQDHGISFDIEDYAEKVVKEGKPGEYWPSDEQFSNLIRAYGDKNIKDMSSNSGNDAGSSPQALDL
tara:strand:+ start:2176 stop:2529 length:354 start_codon:yes stop_codon:yes gene_type:complete